MRRIIVILCMMLLLFTVCASEQIVMQEDVPDLETDFQIQYYMEGYTQALEVYGCANCSGCEHKAKCLYKYNPEKDADKNKVMKISYSDCKETLNDRMERYISKMAELKY